MDVSEYKRRTLEALDAAAAADQEEGVVGDPEATLFDTQASLAERLTAVEAVGRRASESPALIDRLIELAGDRAAPTALRVRTLDVLQALAFQVTIFAPHRPRYHEMLRAMVDDPDLTLRRRALATLARYGDPFARDRLVEGLEHPSRALVPAAKAIQYLGYDIHGLDTRTIRLLRGIAQHPPTQAAQREAVRLLAADPGSKALLTRLLNDKSQPADVRRMSALALQSLAPSSFEKAARKITLDTTDDDRLRATTLGALARHGTPETSTRKGTFTRQVEALDTTASSAQLRRASKSFVERRAR